MKKKIIWRIVFCAVLTCIAFTVAFFVMDASLRPTVSAYEDIYEFAVQFGYEGTREELYERLRGERGEDGLDGVGVQSGYVDENGDLILTLTDGATVNCGSVKGERGETGVGIAGARIDENGILF